MQHETHLWPPVRLISTQYLAGGRWWTCEKYSPSLHRALLRSVAAFKARADKDLTGTAQDGSGWQRMAHYGLWTLGLQPPDVYTLTLWLRCSIKHEPWAGQSPQSSSPLLPLSIHSSEHRHRHRQIHIGFIILRYLITKVWFLYITYFKMSKYRFTHMSYLIATQHRGEVAWRSLWRGQWSPTLIMAPLYIVCTPDVAPQTWYIMYRPLCTFSLYWVRG